MSCLSLCFFLALPSVASDLCVCLWMHVFITSFAAILRSLHVWGPMSLGHCRKEQSFVQSNTQGHCALTAVRSSWFLDLFLSCRSDLLQVVFLTPAVELGQVWNDKLLK